MSRKNNLLVFLLILAYSCNMPYNKESRFLNEYLQEKKSNNIPWEKHWYIVIPKYGCKGCMVNYLTQISSTLPSFSQTAYTIITAYPELCSDSIRERCSIIIDNEGLIDTYDIGINNLTVIKTYKNEIISINCFLIGMESELDIFLDKQLDF